MVKVVGRWELGWSTPIKEYDLWTFPLRDFQVDEWIMTPISGIVKRGVTEVTDIDEAIEMNRELTPVFITEDGAMKLNDFVHPKKALYVLGNVGQIVSANHKDNISVRIQTLENKGLLWPHQAICIVLYDRMVKSGSDN